MRSATLVVFVLGCFLLASLVQCSIPRRSSLRFQEVTEAQVADNSIGNSKLKVDAVGNTNLQPKAITADKINDASIYQRHFSPNSVTSGAAAIELVHVYFRPQDNPAVANSNGNTINIPDLQESILPFENAPSVNPSIQGITTSPIVDNPARATAYRVQGKARGPGTILGWYPAMNGHLLRYQSSRAIRALTCANTLLYDLYPFLGCGCSETLYGDCGCYAYWGGLYGIEWVRDLNCYYTCTTPADICGTYSQLVSPNYPDPQCLAHQFDDIGEHGFRDPNEPDECHTYTSVEDVDNPQEGTPVYSPSVESISIDETGVVEIAFFGRGISHINAADPPIDIIVVVMLNEQYGA